MIDWQIEEIDKTYYKEERWCFPDSKMQSCLLPVINVGNEYIDEYGDTSFDVEDCGRIIGNSKYAIGLLKTRKSEYIAVDEAEHGIVKMKIKDIETCLQKLIEASEKCIGKNGRLVFFGD